MPSHKNGPFVVKSLGDNGEAALPEYRVGPDYGVERSESGVVTVDALCRDPGLEQLASHLSGLVVAARSIIAGDQKVAGLATAIEFGCSTDAIGKVFIAAPIEQVF